MIWKCPYSNNCNTCSHHHIDKSIGKDYCNKNGLNDYFDEFKRTLGQKMKEA